MVLGFFKIWKPKTMFEVDIHSQVSTIIVFFGYDAQKM